VADRIALLWQAKIRAEGTSEGDSCNPRTTAVHQFLERDLEMASSRAKRRWISR